MKEEKLTRLGAGHQYGGNAGEVGNCQVEVFVCLNNNDFAIIIDARLYSPKGSRRECRLSQMDRSPSGRLNYS